MPGDRCLTLDLTPSISFAKPEEKPKNKEWGVAATMDEVQPSLGDWRSVGPVDADVRHLFQHPVDVEGNGACPPWKILSVYVYPAEQSLLNWFITPYMAIADFRLLGAAQ